MNVAYGLPADFAAMSYDAIVVGAGLSGAVCARVLAERANMRVAVLERFEHVAGAAFDEMDDAGILVHRFGPHVYHTSDERVHQFVSRFAQIMDYEHRVLANVHGELMPVPFNRHSLEIAFGNERAEHLYRKLVAAFGEGRKVSLGSLLSKNDPELSDVATYVFQNLYAQYLTKLWGEEHTLSASGQTGRLPVLVGDDDRFYSQAAHQGVPAQGYTAMVSRMLDHDLISVFLGVDALGMLNVSDGRVLVCDGPFGGEVIYTGSLDELFGMDLGPLSYRAIDMEFTTFDVDWFQEAGVVEYTVSEDYLRTTEFKRITGQSVLGKTTILREYPKRYEAGSGQVPCFAVRDRESLERYRRYYERVENVLNLHVVGRLAKYRYYDMDGAIAAALALSDEIMEQR